MATSVPETDGKAAADAPADVRVSTKRAPKELQPLLREHKSLSLVRRTVGDSTILRVTCKLTGHEMPATVPVVTTYVSGRRYKRAVWQNFDYAQFEPWLMPNGHDQRLLWCTLTKRAVNKIPKDVEKHTSGKKFKRLKKEAEAKQAAAKERAALRASKEGKRLAALAQLVRTGTLRLAGSMGWWRWGVEVT